MAIGCGAKLAKYILFVFNIIFWLSGLALITLGAIYAAHGEIKQLENFATPGDPLLTRIAYVMIGVGCFVFVVGFCGCCGAIKESQCLLGLYIAFLFVVMIAELGFGIYVGIKKNEVEADLEKELKEFLRVRYPTSNATGADGMNFKQAVDSIQSESMKCCGVSSYLDWNNTNWRGYMILTGKTWVSTPPSCCPNYDKSAPETGYMDCQTSRTYYTKGCLEAMKAWIARYFPIVIGVGCGIAFLELFGIVAALVLLRNTGKEQSV